VERRSTDRRCRLAGSSSACPAAAAAATAAACVETLRQPTALGDGDGPHRGAAQTRRARYPVRCCIHTHDLIGDRPCTVFSGVIVEMIVPGVGTSVPRRLSLRG
jgi:hypothetical protein